MRRLVLFKVVGEFDVLYKLALCGTFLGGIHYGQ